MAVGVRAFGEMLQEQMSVLARLVGTFDQAGTPYALVGGHAVSAHTRPRLTVDVGMIVEARKRTVLESALVARGFRIQHDRDVWRLFEAAAEDDGAQAVADLLLADSHPVWAEALRTATAGI